MLTTTGSRSPLEAAEPLLRLACRRHLPMFRQGYLQVLWPRTLLGAFQRHGKWQQAFVQFTEHLL